METATNNVHELYTLRLREPEDGFGGPLTTVFLAGVEGARSGQEAAEVYAELAGLSHLSHHGRTNHLALSPEGHNLPFHSRKAQR